MGLFKPGWMASDEKKAVAAVHRIPQHKQATLVEAAHKGRPAVRIAAIQRIEDPAELEKLSRASHFPEVKMAAADRLGHDKTLQQRRYADIILQGQGGGFIGREKKTLAKITDQTLLMQVALEDIARFSGTAASLITDQELLIEVARRTTSPSIRFDTAIRLDNAEARQAHLKAIARNTDISQSLRLSAAYRLEDEAETLDVITDVLFRARTQYECGNQALGKLAAAAPERLVPLASTHPTEHVSWKVLERIDDPRAIEEVARKATHWSVRLRAVVRLESPALLADLALEEPHHYVLQRILEKLDEPETLERLARQCKSMFARAMAASYLKDPAVKNALLTEIAGQTQDDETRLYAALHMEQAGKKQLLLEILDTAAEPYVLASAAYHLGDTERMAAVYAQVAEALDNTSRGYNGEVRKSMCATIGHNFSGCSCVRCGEEFHTWVEVPESYGGAHDGCRYCDACGLYG